MARRGSNIYKDPRSGRFVARVVDAYGKRRAKTFKRERDARRWLTEQRATRDAVREGATPIERPTRPRVLFGTYAGDWLERRRGKLRPSSLARYTEHVTKVRKSSLADVPVDELNRDHIIRWLRVLAEYYSGYSCLGMLRVLRTMTADMKAEHRLLHWACERVSRPKSVSRYTKAAPNLLTANELRALLAAAESNSGLGAWRCMIALIAFTGLRFCEAAALRWRDVDFEAGEIVVCRSVYRREIVEAPKTGMDRTVPMVDELARALKRHRTAAPGVGDALVFPARGGGPRCTGALSKPLARALKLAGIRKRLTPHALRRTFNDLAAQIDTTGGITTRAITGHSDVSMTEHYRHVGTGEKAALQLALVRAVKGDV